MRTSEEIRDRNSMDFCGEHSAKCGWMCAGNLQKCGAALRVESLHSADEERKSFLAALCSRMTCTNHEEKCNKFHADTWKTHVRILRP